MKNLKKRFLVWTRWFWLCWIVLFILGEIKIACAGESVIVYAADNKGENVLALVSLPDNAFATPIAAPNNPNSGREDNLEPLKATIIARGVSMPSQGAEDSVLYWKGATLWRYHKGVYRQIAGAPPVQGPGGEAKESATTIGLIALPQSGNNLEHPEVGIYTLLLKIGSKAELKVALAAPDTGQEPVGWLYDGRLLVREFQFDRIKRLKTSKFWILNSEPLNENDEPAKPLTRTDLTNVTPPQLELSATMAPGKVAFQVFDEATDKFRLGVCRLAQTPEGKNVVEWLPVPPGRKPDYYQGDFNQQFLHVGWSPDGRYLEFGANFLGIAIWDDEKRVWLKRNEYEISFFGVDSTFKLLWLDSDRVISSEDQNEGSFLRCGRMSEFNRKMTMLGQLQNLWVKEVFRIKLDN